MTEAEKLEGWVREALKQFAIERRPDGVWEDHRGRPVPFALEFTSIARYVRRKTLEEEQQYWMDRVNVEDDGSPTSFVRRHNDMCSHHIGRLDATIKALDEK